MDNSISGFNYYKTKPAKTFGSMNRGTVMDDPVSTCCGADAGDWEDVGMCPECGEHCEFVEAEELEE